MKTTFLRVATLAGVLGLVACTAIVTSDDPVQCKNDGDCTKRGADFADSTCSAGFCVPKPPASTTPDASTEPEASTGIPGAECTTNAECASKGAGFVCSSNMGKCAPTTSEDCAVVYGDPTVEGTVLYGLMSEVGVGDTNYFRQKPYEYAAKLAFKEFFETTAVKFPGGRGGALISCSEHAPRRAAALLGNAGVKAILGPSGEDRQRPILETILPARIPTFSPWINGNPAAVVEGSSGFAWLAGFQRSEVIAPLNAYLADKEKAIRAKNGNKKIRVAVVINHPSADVPASFNAYGEFYDLTNQRLSFNGTTAILNASDPECTGGCFKQFDTNQSIPANVLARAQDIADFKPDVVIPFTDIDFGAQLLQKLENAFASASIAPTYIHPFLQIEDAGYRALNLSDPTLRDRIGGIRPIRDNSFEVFSGKYVAALTTPTAVGAAPNPGAGRAFETSLLLLLASYAAFVDHANASPEQIVAALPQVTKSDSGVPRITLTDLSTAVATLNQKQPINFDGLFSTFDLDFAQHSSPATWTEWCPTDLGQYVSSGRVFKTDTFEGTATACK